MLNRLRVAVSLLGVAAASVPGIVPSLLVFEGSGGRVNFEF